MEEAQYVAFSALPHQIAHVQLVPSRSFVVSLHALDIIPRALQPIGILKWN